MSILRSCVAAPNQFKIINSSTKNESIIEHETCAIQGTIELNIEMPTVKHVMHQTSNIIKRSMQLRVKEIDIHSEEELRVAEIYF